MQTTLTTTKSEPLEITEDIINQFTGYIQSGVDAWVKAGKLLVQMVERNPNCYAIITKHDPRISIDTLLCFERIGRGEIFPQLLLDNSPGSRKLIRMSYSAQCKYSREKVPIVISVRNGKPEVIEKAVHQLTKKEAELVFGHKNIRTVAEQAEMVEFQNRPSVPRPVIPQKEYETLGFWKLTTGKGGKVELIPISRSSPDCDFASKRLIITKDNRGGISSEVFEVKREIL